MSAGHTQGRLSTDCADHDEPYQNIKLQVGKHAVATVCIDDAPVHDYNREQRANARRLAACWNACQGIETEELEIIDDAGENFTVVFDRIKAQRDELLSALQMFVFPHQDNDKHTDTQRQEIGRAVIAKVSGVPT